MCMCIYIYMYIHIHIYGSEAGRTTGQTVAAATSEYPGAPARGVLGLQIYAKAVLIPKDPCTQIVYT